MTAVIGAPAGTYFTLRMYKKLTTNPALSWANNYEFVSNTVIDDAEALALVTAVADFERAIHLPDAQMDRAVLSSWIEDGEPYDPTSFITYPLTGIGQRADAGEALSLNYCLFVRRQVDFGNNGKIFYRRVLTEADVNAPSGTAALLNQALFNTFVQDQIDNTGLTAYLGNGSTFGMRMKSALLIDRPVKALIVTGARVIQFNNRYFDVP